MHAGQTTGALRWVTADALIGPGSAHARRRRICCKLSPGGSRNQAPDHLAESHMGGLLAVPDFLSSPQGWRTAWLGIYRGHSTPAPRRSQPGSTYATHPSRSLSTGRLTTLPSVGPGTGVWTCREAHFSRTALPLSLQLRMGSGCPWSSQDTRRRANQSLPSREGVRELAFFTGSLLFLGGRSWNEAGKPEFQLQGLHSHASWRQQGSLPTRGRDNQIHAAPGPR